MFSSMLLNEFVSNIPNWEENPVDSRTQTQECFDVDHILKERNVEPRKVTSAPDKTWREKQASPLFGTRPVANEEELKITEDEFLQFLVNISSSDSDALSSSDVSSESDDCLDSSGSTVKVAQEYCGLDGKIYSGDDTNHDYREVHNDAAVSPFDEYSHQGGIAFDIDVFNFDSSGSDGETSSLRSHGEDAHKQLSEHNEVENAADINSSSKPISNHHSVVDAYSSRRATMRDKFVFPTDDANGLFDFSSSDGSSHSSFHRSAQGNRPSRGSVQSRIQSPNGADGSHLSIWEKATISSSLREQEELRERREKERQRILEKELRERR